MSLYNPWVAMQTCFLSSIGRPLLVVAVLITGSSIASGEGPFTTIGSQSYESRTIEGWTVHIDARLLSEQPEAVETAMPLLKKQLEEVVHVVPETVVERLREVPLWFSPEYPNVPGRAEYHPDAGWLRANGRNPAMAKGVEFTDTRNFEREMSRMPNFTLHELAHAYHDRVLSFDQPAIIDTFKKARAAKLYERVERSHGNGRANSFEAAYALTDHKEYFAETSEAFFSRNDFFPFDRDELQKYDPQMFDVLKQVWEIAR